MYVHFICSYLRLANVSLKRMCFPFRWLCKHILGLNQRCVSSWFRGVSICVNNVSLTCRNHLVLLLFNVFNMAMKSICADMNVLTPWGTSRKKPFGKSIVVSWIPRHQILAFRKTPVQPAKPTAVQRQKLYWEIMGKRGGNSMHPSRWFCPVVWIWR